LAEISQRCSMPLAATQSLFRWLVFNVLVGNTDAHLKNLSFLVAGDDVQLAPFYDLLSTAVYETCAFGKSRWPDQVDMAWPIQGSSRMRLIEAAQTLGIPGAAAKRQLAFMRKNIQEQATLLLEEVQQENADLLQQRPELAATFAGEMRCLRAIVHVVIQDMYNQTA